MSDCIEWTGTRWQSGYGREGRRGRAHRLTWETAYGPIPDDMVIMHTCDNPPCVNLDHLRLGTVADNNQDCREKGRARHGTYDRRGNRNHHAVLTEADVRTIRERRRNGDLLKDIAATYGVALSTIGEINRGRSWTHVQ